MVSVADRNVTYGDKVFAMGSDPTDPTAYEFVYKVIPLTELVASHTEDMQPNTEYPQELQPRIRSREASRTQIDNIARNLNPKVLLVDTGLLETGAMIVGRDNVVESGNGRVLALRRAREQYPERYKLYKTMLASQASNYGLSSSNIESIDNPVLVRERITDVDRADFARQANVGAIMGMSPYEQARQDAVKLSAEAVSNLEVGENQTIDQALRSKANDSVIQSFVKIIPANERATISDEKGNLNLQGITRLKNVLFAKTYTGEAGERLARIFSESADSYVKQIENSMFQSLPDMAKAEGMIESGQRDEELQVRILKEQFPKGMPTTKVSDSVRGMKLLPKALEKQLPNLYETEGIPSEDKKVIAKYFHPMSNYTWYAVEYDPKQRLFFGLVDGQEKEWGYFSLDELENTVVKGLPIERDMYFDPTAIKDIPGLIETPQKTPSQIDEKASEMEKPTSTIPLRKLKPNYKS